MKLSSTSMSFVLALFIVLVPATALPQLSTSNTNLPPSVQMAVNSSPTQTSLTPKSYTSGSMQVSPEELYMLQKLRIQTDLQEDIMKWAQTRFWFVAITILLIGFFGVRALVREFVSGELKDAMRASADAQSAAQSARESIKEVRTEAAKYRDLVDSASSTAADVSEKLGELKSRIETEGTRSVAAADLKIGAVSEQIEALRKTVTDLATDSERNRNILKKAEARIHHARATAESFEAEFLSNAKVNVLLVPFSDDLCRQLTSEISSSLSQKGFKVSVSPWSAEYEKERSTDISIVFDPRFQNKANVIENIVRKVFENKTIKTKISLMEKMQPISGSDARIVIFFRKEPTTT